MMTMFWMYDRCEMAASVGKCSVSTLVFTTCGLLSKLCLRIGTFIAICSPTSIPNARKTHQRILCAHSQKEKSPIVVDLPRHAWSSWVLYEAGSISIISCHPKPGPKTSSFHSFILQRLQGACMIPSGPQAQHFIKNRVSLQHPGKALVSW